ncbi:MAG: GTPase Era [Candidatus Omnitrophica bacterium]|nr:GTPase Era [Candidatus Omnitrophota bacterium]
MEKNKKFKSGYVALLGKPNVGKSTLLNYFLQEKLSIVTEKPQTTRDVIRGIFTQGDYQIIFVDTPGMHKPRTQLGQHMMRSAVSAGVDADVVIVIIDALSGITAADGHIFRMIESRKVLKGCRWSAVLINKTDAIKKEDMLPLMKQCAGFPGFDEYIPVSAQTGENCGQVLDKIIKALPYGPSYYPKEQLTDKNERFIVAELIRESLLKLCREEVPHSVAVEVENFKDNPGRKTLIQATVFLERQAQKKIVIGRSGIMLKTIGTDARGEIEKFLGRPVYLELRVKTHVNWRKDVVFLRRLGYDKSL